jgi:hypothetical protein
MQDTVTNVMTEARVMLMRKARGITKSAKQAGRGEYHLLELMPS